MRFIPTLEQSIVDRLAPIRRSGILVRALPDQPSEKGEPVNGEVLVKLARTVGQPPSGLGSGRANAEVECNLFVRLRNLRNGEAGAWEVLGAITDYLVGFVPTGGASKLWLRTSEMVAFEHGWWIFDVQLAVPVLMLETTDTEGLTQAIFTAFQIEGTGNLVGGPVLNYPEIEIPVVGDTINGELILINGDPVILGV